MPNSIRKYRENAHFTRQELAKKLGISADCIKRYENGKFQPRAETLKQLAKIFNCTVDDLLKETE